MTTMQGSLASHEEQDRRLLILYATETGNAQDVADRIARAFRNLRFRSHVVSVDCYSLVRQHFAWIGSVKLTIT